MEDPGNRDCRDGSEWRAGLGIHAEAWDFLETWMPVASAQFSEADLPLLQPWETLERRRLGLQHLPGKDIGTDLRVGSGEGVVERHRLSLQGLRGQVADQRVLRGVIAALPLM